ncbi:MAG: hypothetical protein H7301_10355 [Cryobacterium sp.]|nr:hypothetical protein [Oligoflexia bacterium]
MTGKNIPNTAGITAEETHALFWYKIGQLGNYEMNAALRSGNANEIDKWGTYVRVLASALNKLPHFSGVAYRHADLTSNVINGYKKARSFSSSTYVATPDI